jgi:hypothetical protein
MKGEKTAILDTSSAREVTYTPDGNGFVSARASDRLLELLDEGYTVYIASTRTELKPEYDSCILDRIPAERIFTANPELSTREGANASAFIDLWVRILNEVGVEVPEIINVPDGWDNTSWLDLRFHAQKSGVVIS